MFNYFDYFLPTNVTFYNALPVKEAIQGYEFELYAFATNKNEGYAIVVGPDEGRINDIDQIIQSEFDADIDGWLVLLPYQTANEKIIRHPSAADLEKITYTNSTTTVWIIKITLRSTSRLLK